MTTNSRTSAPRLWGVKEIQLWDRISKHPFERPDDGLDFHRRLMREQGWTAAFARAAIEEYRRFHFLICVQSEPLTPSVAVDQVWHLHMTYSRDYWGRWCGDALRQPVHHEPTRGGRDQGIQFDRQYARTLATYETYFGTPPWDLWPPAVERFANAARWRWVDGSQHWIIAKPKLSSLSSPRAAVGACLILVAPLAVALPINPLNWSSGPFLAMYTVGAVLALLAALQRRFRRIDEPRAAHNVAELDAASLALLAGDKQRLVDTIVVEALQDDVVRLPDASGALARGDAVPDASRRELLAAVEQGGGPTEVRRHLNPVYQRVRHSLERRGLMFSRADARREAWAAAMFPLSWAAFGVVRILAGVSRGESVGLTALVMLVAAATGVWLLAQPRRLTRAGSDALALARIRHSRLVRAPQVDQGELAVAVALAGTSVMATTVYADYHNNRTATVVGGCGAATGKGGDGGCGGGCGGCGG